MTKGSILVFLSAVCFGTEAIFVKLAYTAGLSPLALTVSRLLIALVLLGPVYVAHILRHRMDSRTHLVLILSGGVVHVMVMGFLALSLSLTSASVTILCLYLYPTVTTLAAAPILGERITGRKLLALAGSLVGVGFVAWSPDGAIAIAGVALALAAAVFNGLLMVIVKRYLTGIPPIVASAGMLTWGAIVYAVIGLATGVSLAMPAAAFTYVAGMGVISTVIALTLLYAGLGMIEASRASIIATVEPAVTAVLAAILLGERLTAIQLTGGALIVGSTLLVALGEQNGRDTARIVAD